MKKSSALLIAAALILSSCGIVAQHADSGSSWKFQDGIYNNAPSFRTKAEKDESRSEAQALAEKTKESPIYLFGDKKDTIMIPQDMSATIRFDQKLGGTVVTVGENPYDWRYDLENNYGYYYGPYSIGSSWYWSRHYSPWYWNTWAYTPWRYHGWYDPFYIGGWYDPWYYGGWYGSWYYSGWYDPWYYGGWYPHHHHHGYWPSYTPDRPDHHGKEVVYGPKERVFSTGNTIRGGAGGRTFTDRNGTGTGTSTGRVATRKSQAVSNSTAPARAVVSTRTSATKVDPADRQIIRRTAPATARPASGTTAARPTVSAPGSRPVTAAGRTGVSPQANHRKPAVTSPSASGSRPATVNNSTSVSTDRNSGYNRSAPSSDRSSGYDRSTPSRSSSSYNRSSSSSSSSSRSSFSSGGGTSSRSSGASRSR